MESLPVEMRRMVFEHFSNTELLEISLVNKLFNYEARKLMSTRANLNADFDMLLSHRAACQNVRTFLVHLKRMDVIPFSGIKIRCYALDHNKLCWRRPDEMLDPPLLDILDRVAWKRLSIKMYGGRFLPKKCPALQLVQKILKDFSFVLEELELNNHGKLLRFVQEIAQETKFPRLKVLKLKGTHLSYDRQWIQKSFIKDMVAIAPNLKEFHRDGPPDLTKNLLEGSSSAALILSNYNCFNPAHHEFAPGFTGTVKLKEVDFYYNAESFCMDKFKRTTPRILQSSFDTLHSIVINLVFLVPLMGYGGLCLINVTEFGAYIDFARWELTEPRIFLLLKQFDFTRIFPKLDKVTVGAVPCYDCIPADYVTEFVNAAVLQEEPSPDRVVNIKNLSICESLTTKAVPFFAGMFPNVDKLETNINNGEQQVPYSSIWKHWPELKEIFGSKFSSYTDRTCTTRNDNLDSDFCGIFPEEVALLREQDDEYLRAVHIVPVMPSLTCLRALKTLRVVRHYHNPCRVVEEDMDPIFSKITTLIAFQRCGHIFLNIQTNSKQMLEALNHLSPYVLVQLDT